MQRVHFCSGTAFDTGDAIAEALVSYAHAVASMGKHAVVAVPAHLDGDDCGSVTLLLNETSQLSTETLPATGGELVDEMCVRRLHGLAADLMAPFTWDDTVWDDSALT